MKCPDCGVTVSDMPEDSVYEEHLCNKCYARHEPQEENLKEQYET